MKSESSSEGPFVSVVIPVYNDAERLARCLAALEEQTYSADAYEVIAVDNGSDESIAPVVAHFAQTRVAHEEQRGSYAARNRGIAVARGEVLAFTDSDCVPAPDWIAQGVHRLRALPGGKGVAGGGIDFFFREEDRPNAVEAVDSSSYLDQERYCNETGFAVTANLFAPRALIEDAGSFDADLQSGGDSEWGARVRTHGYAVVYADRARVAHPARSSFTAHCKKVRRVVRGRYEKKREKGEQPATILRGLVASAWQQLRRVTPRLLASRLPVWGKCRAMVVLMVVEGGLRVWQGVKCWARDRGGYCA